MRLIQITNRVCGSSKVLGGHERQEIEMARRDSGQAGGPAIRAIDPWHLGNPPRGKPRQLLSDAERAHLGALASIIRFKKGEKIYVGPRTIITPSARDLGEPNEVFVKAQ